MAKRPPRICGCGRVVAAGVKCPCQLERDKARRQSHDKNRPSAAARGYDAKWREYRKGFLQHHPVCLWCGAPATVVDHIQPHKGDAIRFWSADNHQPLCAHCHNSRKQSNERKGAVQ